MASLYAMKQEYIDLLGQLEEAPEDAEQILGQIEALQEDIGDKAEAYARIIQGKEREAEMYDAEIRRLQLLKSRASGVADRLRGNLLGAMLSVDASEIRTSIGKWSLRTNPASVRVLDDRQIPPELYGAVADVLVYVFRLNNRDLAQELGGAGHGGDRPPDRR